MPVYTNPTIDQEPLPKIVYYFDNKCAIFTCNGSPEGVILANTGSIALSDNASVYKKTTDDVNTGWVELQSGTLTSPVSITGTNPILNFIDTTGGDDDASFSLDADILTLTIGSNTIVFRNNGLIAGFPKNLESNITPVGNVGGGTDNLMSFVVPGGSLASAGDQLRIKMSGTASAQDGGAGDQRAFTWTYGGQSIDARIIQAINALCTWDVQIVIARIDATTARYISIWNAWNTATAAAVTSTFLAQGTITITHANNNTFLLTASSTDAVNNDCVQQILSIDLVQR